MSFSLSISGHKDNQDVEALDAVIEKVVEAFKDADVGLSYISLSDSRGFRQLFNSSVASVTDAVEETPVDEEDDEEEDPEED